MEYRSDIERLRAVAVLSVLVYHFFPSILPGGFIGVDIFFVISGFLISSLLLSSLKSGRFSLLEFYRRRIRRILPALIPVLSFLLIAGAFLLFAD
jgi:peptidoglycan/LPS O-acetylase OafA/YrhL